MGMKQGNNDYYVVLVDIDNKKDNPKALNGNNKNNTRLKNKNIIKIIMRKNNFHLMTVLHEELSAFCDPELNKIMIDSLSGYDFMVAEAIEYVYRDKLLFVDNEWYLFNSKWNKCNIHEDIFVNFILLYDAMIEPINNCDGVFAFEKYECINKINKIKNNILKKNKTIVSFLKTCFMSKTTDEYISFDTQKNLFAFSNGVYDFDKMTFRDIVPNDMIAKSNNFKYSDTYTNKKELIEMLLNIFPSREVMECFLTYIALSLSGKNDSDILMLLQWSIKNIRYRRILTNLLTSVCGDYCCIVNDSEFTTTNNKIIRAEDSAYLKTIRIAIFESIKYTLNTEVDIYDLIDSKTIKIKDKNNIAFETNIDFSVICMCDETPQNILDMGIENNIGYVVMLENNYENKKALSNDLFLLLVEQLFKINNVNNISKVMEKIKYVKYDGRTDAQKICNAFMCDHIRFATEIKEEETKFKCECNIVFEKYLEWAKDQKNKKVYKLLGKYSLYDELDKYFTRCASSRVSGKKSTTSVFFNMRFANSEDKFNEDQDDRLRIKFFEKSNIIHNNINENKDDGSRTISFETFIKRSNIIHSNSYDYSKSNYYNTNTKINIECKMHGIFTQSPAYHMKGGKCPKCNLCPACQLWKTSGKLCEYCKPYDQNKLYAKTKEMQVVKYLREELPEHEFIHNKSVGKDCTDGHLFPDVRFDCGDFELILEVDENRHRGAAYACDKKRMYDIIAKLGKSCAFIRYNPDNKLSDIKILLATIKSYLSKTVDDIQFNDYGFVADYLFYD